MSGFLPTVLNPGKAPNMESVCGERERERERQRETERERERESGREIKRGGEKELFSSR